jgi:hypothetical protein
MMNMAMSVMRSGLSSSIIIIASKVFNVMAFTGVPVRDATSGFRAFRREVLEALDVTSLHAEGYSFQIEGVLRAWRAGFTITEIPITFVERRTGSSKISRAIVLEAIWRVLVWSLRARRGRRAPS